MDITWPQGWTWATVAGVPLVTVAWWLIRRARKLDERREAYKAALADAHVAEDAYHAALENAVNTGEVRQAREALDEARRRCDALRKSLPVLLVALALAGCVTRTKEVERIVQLDEHIRIVQPGDMVPDYPSAETRWWLVSPTGLIELMPKYRQEEF